MRMAVECEGWGGVAICVRQVLVSLFRVPCSCHARWPGVLLWLALMMGDASAADPFLPVVDFGGAGTGRWVRVVLPVPAGHFLYADRTDVKAELPWVLEPISAPTRKVKRDPFSGEEVNVFARESEFLFRVSGPEGQGAVRVRYQGCNEAMCFLPGDKVFRVGVATVATNETGAAEPRTASKLKPVELLSSGLRMTGRVGGYLAPGEFLSFLDRVEGGAGLADEDVLRDTLRRKGVVLLVLLVLVGGVLLNLTPCVLPMIPVNLAIIGAGVQGGGRLRGLALGAVYGLGMALAYGGLGVVVVLGGARFGVVNSSAAFNFGVAGLFLFMALAMFDVVHVDFSRFQSGTVGKPGGRGSFALAFGLGALAAVLAGACVAPVLISVLLLSADLYGAGHASGLALPFVLGIGMALPWPVAGAGLAFLPKPGAWMVRVRQAFGLMIVGFALWYGWVGYQIVRGSPGEVGAKGAGSEVAHGVWTDSLEEGLARARAEGKPVLIDFWATWCKNCTKMERTTFRDSRVIARLAEKYIPIRFQAEDPSDPRVREVMEKLGILGLPSYVVLAPEGAGP